MNEPAALVEGVIVALGERRCVGAFALAGAQVRPAEDPDQVRQAWDSLGPGVGLVILSAGAAAALGDRIDDVESPLTAVLPT